MADGPKLFRVMLEVGDLEAAGRFYATLFGVPGQAVGGGRQYFDCNGTIVGVVDVGPGGRAPQASGQDLYFAVAELDAVHARARGLEALSVEDVHGEGGGEILTRPWGERSFYAIDPWGNGLCFVDEATLFTGRR
jgi:predicted enzyme related to lactoylglutathione lyase